MADADTLWNYVQNLSGGARRSSHGSGVSAPPLLWGQRQRRPSARLKGKRRDVGGDEVTSERHHPIGQSTRAQDGQHPFHDT